MWRRNIRSALQGRERLITISRLEGTDLIAMAPRWLRALPLLALGTSLTAMAPAQALVPYAYVPQTPGAGRGNAWA
jgi:hypothetical protein